MAAAAHRQRVGAELRRFREQLGLSGVQVAEALGWSQSKVSRIETARFAATVWELAALLDYYGVPEEVRAELLTVAAADSGLTGAWIVRAGGTPRRQGEVAAVETRLRRLAQYQAMVVPGQLQSFDYSRALARAAGFPDPDEIATRRRRRQALLEAPDAPAYEAVLDERALSRWAGPAEVLLGQLDYIIERSSHPAITLRLLRTGGGADAVAAVPFVIYEFREPTSPTVVFVETHTADMYLSAEQDVQAYGRLFDRLKGEAMGPEESVAYLADLADQIRQRSETGKESR